MWSSPVLDFISVPDIYKSILNNAEYATEGTYDLDLVYSASYVTTSPAITSSKKL